MEENMLPLLLLIMALLSCSVMAALRCGNCGHTPVPFPHSTGPNCGDPMYKIWCNVGTLWLDTLNRSSYIITSINPETQRMIIRPASVTPNTCLATDFHSEGIPLDENLPFNITSSNTVLLMNCTDAMFQQQLPMNCSSSCICHAYISSTPLMATCMRESICCMFRTGGSENAYLIRVRGDRCSAYQSFVNLDPSLMVAKWPERGVEIEVLPREPICRLPGECREFRNSKCLPDPENVGQSRCLCNAGRRWDPIHGLCLKCDHKRMQSSQEQNGSHWRCSGNNCFHSPKHNSSTQITSPYEKRSPKDFSQGARRNHECQQ